MLVATDREVVVIDVERGASALTHGISDRPTCLAADPLVRGRAWCGTHRGGVFRSDDGGRSWQSVGLAGRLIMAVTASPAARDVVWVGTEPSEVWRSVDAGHYVGADQPTGDTILVVGMVLSAETRYTSRSLDCVPPAGAGTTLGRDRGRRARVHDRWWPHLARPRSWWTVGHSRTRHSPQRSRYSTRLRWRWIFRERRRRCDVALAPRRSRGRLLAERGYRFRATAGRRGISLVRTALRVSGWSLGWPVVSASHSRALGARPRRLARTTEHNRAAALRRGQRPENSGPPTSAACTVQMTVGTVGAAWPAMRRRRSTCAASH